MAYVKITSGAKLKPTVDYLVKGKPKFDDSYVQGKRALGIRAVNASPIPSEFISQQDWQYHQQHTPKNNAHVIRTIVSFSKNELDYRKLNDRHKALKICQDYIKNAYPDNSSLIVEQADNKNHILHCHIATNARTFTTGKSTTHNAITRKQLPLVHQAMIDNGIQPQDKIKTTLSKPARIPHMNDSNRTVQGIRERGKVSWVHQIAKTIDNAKRNSRNLDSFIHFLHNHDISIIHSFRLHRQRGTHKKSLHYYKNKGKDGIQITSKNIKHLKNVLPNNLTNNINEHIGKYIRPKRNSLLFSDGTHTISASKLGKPYSRVAINQAIKHNHISSRQLTPKQRLYKSADNPQLAKKLMKEAKNSLARDEHPKARKGKATKQYKSNQHRTPKRPFTLSDLHPKHKIYNAPHEILLYKPKSELTLHIQKKDKKTNKKVDKFVNVPKPRLYTDSYVHKPIMEFHPKSHAVSKALNNFTSTIDKIKANTNKGSQTQKIQIERAEEECEFKKQEAEKIEANEEDYYDFVTVLNNNKLAEKAYYQNLADYNEAQRQQKLRARRMNGPSW